MGEGQRDTGQHREELGRECRPQPWTRRAGARGARPEGTQGGSARLGGEEGRARGGSPSHRVNDAHADPESMESHQHTCRAGARDWTRGCLGCELEEALTLGVEVWRGYEKDGSGHWLGDRLEVGLPGWGGRQVGSQDGQGHNLWGWAVQGGVHQGARDEADASLGLGDVAMGGAFPEAVPRGENHLGEGIWGVDKAREGGHVGLQGWSSGSGLKRRGWGPGPVHAGGGRGVAVKAKDHPSPVLTVSKLDLGAEEALMSQGRPFRGREWPAVVSALGETASPTPEQHPSACISCIYNFLDLMVL